MADPPAPFRLKVSVRPLEPKLQGSGVEWRQKNPVIARKCPQERPVALMQREGLQTGADQKVPRCGSGVGDWAPVDDLGDQVRRDL
jgi:hypothetical protein